MKHDKIIYYLPIEEDNKNVSAFPIQSWYACLESDGVYPEDAMDFIKKAEALGNFCSVSEFTNKLNYQEINTEDYYFFAISVLVENDVRLSEVVIER